MANDCYGTHKSRLLVEAWYQLEAVLQGFCAIDIPTEVASLTKIREAPTPVADNNLGGKLSPKVREVIGGGDCVDLSVKTGDAPMNQLRTIPPSSSPATSRLLRK